MDRGSRLITVFQSLEKLHSQRQGHKFNPEELHQLRYNTSKILQYVSAADKVHRDLVLKSSGYLDILLTTLEAAGDVCVEHNVVFIINELIGKTHTGKRASLLVAHGATHILLQTLVCGMRADQVPDDFLILIHQVLAKLGPKDRKFGVKARLSQALPVTSSLIRTSINNPKLLQPLLHVLKLYAANAVNASYLGKNGIISHLFKVLAICAKKHLSLLKYVLDTLGLLVKSKSNSARVIGQGGVPILLNMFIDWHRGDSKNRHIQLRKAILHVIKHITNLKSGRKALMEADGIRMLYNACLESIECRELESLIVLASLIMRKCFPRNRLPVSSLRGPITCPLPSSDFHTPETGEGLELTTESLPELEPSVPGDDPEYESSVDNDDDISSDDDPEAHKMESEEDADPENPVSGPRERSWTDLSTSYKQFFSELHDFDCLLEGELPPPVFTDQPILIPTGSLSASAARGGAQHSRHGIMSRHSAPNLISDDLSSALSDLRMSALNLDCEVPVLSTRAHGRLHGLSTDSERKLNRSPVSAVNAKTGTSIFSLDISPKVTRKPLSPIKSRRNSAHRTHSSASVGGHDVTRTATKCYSKCEDIDNKIPDSNQSDSARTAQSASSTNSGSLCDNENSACDETNGAVECEEDISAKGDDSELYMQMAAQTRSVGCFNKVAYPDMHGHIPPPFKEPLVEKQFGVQRGKIFEDIDRFINPEQVTDDVVYDLDSAVTSAGSCYNCDYSNVTNKDEIRVTRRDEISDHLEFNGQFESGNLRKVVRVRPYEYDLILSPDVNTNHHHQWFYFEVSNMEAGMKYRFNIVNCEKLNSQFNYGMRPVMFSVTEAMYGRPYWVRAGTEICYYKNHFLRSSQTTGGVRGKSYFTATFTITFKHHRDICYIAYHFPYTYSMLKTHIYRWEQSYDSSQIYFKHQTLCETIMGNSVPVLTITSHPSSYDKEGIEALKNRPYIFLSCRVHPGESNSSWVMRGTINYLLSTKASAQNLRDNYIFKIVPMLNPDGVINGNHRCSVVAEDLNRRWLQPCPKLHPTIYHTKGLLQYLTMMGKSPLVFCDYHGHSRRKNVFLYGCSPSLSWMTEDLENPAFSGNKGEDTGYKTLPRILHNIAPAFSLSNCSFMVEKSKEATARVVVWRQIGIVRSYTMESTYCGCDQGPYRGLHISTRELEETGRKFCEGLLKVRSRTMQRRASSGSLTGLLGASSSTEMGADDRSDLSSLTCGYPEHNQNADIALPGSNSDSSDSDSNPSDLEEGIE